MALEPLPAADPERAGLCRPVKFAEAVSIALDDQLTAAQLRLDGIGEGQSFGKKIMRIKVIKVNDLSNCTMGVSVIRNLIGIFIVLIPFVGCANSTSKCNISVIVPFFII